MNPLSKIADATLGRIIRWAGQHWGAGAETARRQPELRAALLEAMGDAVAAGDKLGHGWNRESTFQFAGQEAEAKASVALGQITDDELAGIGVAFLAASGEVFNYVGNWTEQRKTLRTLRDLAGARVRVLEKKG